MSLTEAFICDYKNHLVTEDRAVGVIPVEDVFDKLHSFPSHKGRGSKPSDCRIHYCLDCYRDFVLTPAANMVDRRLDEEGYKKKVLELAYGLRSQTVRNFIDKNRSTHGKEKR